LLPRLGARGLKLDRDFFVAFSPERVDPGNPRFFTKNTPKVLGGASPASLEVASALYQTFIERLVPVSDTDTAEMVKLLENTFRAVNIGLVNEVAIMCQRLGLDAWEVIEAAASKPFGFMPFYPGPGLGGHCIPVDPLYLSWKLKTLKYNARFIELADEINSAMPEFVLMRVADALNDRRKSVNGSKILLCGITYKRDVDDVRESPAFDVMELLAKRGARVDYHDPYVPRTRVHERTLASVAIETAGAYDGVVIVTDHSTVDYAALVARAQLVVDCRNATRGLRARFRDKIVPL
jgi:UDP-N-acetyl-D-glucosamine dehydrogenase